MKLGEILLKKSLISPAQLDEALKESTEKREFIGKVLARLNMITQAQLLEVLAEQMALTFYPSLKDIKIPQNVIDAVPVKFVWHYKIMPLSLKGKVLTVAVSDPMVVWSMEELELHLGLHIERALSTEEEILAAIRKHYGFGAATVEEILSRNPADSRAADEKEVVEDVEKTAENASVINLVNQILTEAINNRATDIHIEPYREKVRVRQRIDGVLYDINASEQIKYLHPAMVSRIKILANLNLVEKRMPQDGRTVVKLQNRQVDLRISIIPSVYGESVVIRLLPVNFLFNIEDLGFFPEDLAKLDSIMRQPHGIIFLTGPTGSGKTTTLYTFLSRLNKNDIKIITLEDPVEYELEGITQINVRPEIGFTFAAALRNLLRHDPDIMMLGEVRDRETAELSIRTALTGHLIFSTLHTNDAAGGPARLIDIGVEPYLVASSVNAFISQRLVRTICPFCKEEVIDKSNLPLIYRNIAVYKGKGCKECNNMGYRGRTTIYEMLMVVPEIQELILAKAPAAQIKQAAAKLGFKSLRDVGLRKIAMGITTPEEVMQVVEE
jgi:type II secretory ATPase GspE/PulE/Tfp pilus assembly ATPase PilB-like protein